MTKDVETYFIDGCGRCSLGGTPACKVHTWEKELALLRSFILDCGLTEECKWGSPCYTYNGANVLMLSTFKDYCFISFFKGALLSDTQKQLVKLTENVQSGRMLNYTSPEKVIAQEQLIKTYIFEAIEIEKAGLKVPTKTLSDYPIPEELEEKFANDESFKIAFQSLTPGRQKGYLLFFAAAKQSSTRTSRIEKWTEQIMRGKGMHD